MDSTTSYHEVKTWLLSMMGKKIDVRIIQKTQETIPPLVIWKGPGKVLRCVREGVVLDLSAGTASWWGKIFGNWGVKHVVTRWTQKPVSVPYCDLSIDRDPKTGVQWLVIDAATWTRSPEELTEKSSVENKLPPTMLE